MNRYLLALWESGGALPPIFGLARRLIERGHTVHVIADATVEDHALAAGCTFETWRTAPNRVSLDPEHDPMKDWEVSNPMEMLRRARDEMISGPAAAYAADTRAAIGDLSPDVVLTDAHLVGVIVGAQAESVPVVALVPNIWMIPTEGAPAIGPGFGLPTNGLQRFRDRMLTRMVNRVFDKGLPELNHLRSSHGLDPLDSVYDQVTTADAIVVLASPAFDFASPFVPDNVHYVGPILDDPHWASGWDSPWAADDERPLLLVGLSSTFMDQADLLRRIVTALSALPVRAVVTLGQAVDPAEVPGSENVHVVPSAPHAPILAEADAVITHCGHGTTMKALEAGLPLVCVPMGRDQNDNAARVVHHGAGVRLKPSASVDAIGTAVRSVLEEPTYRDAARSFARVLEEERRSIDPIAVIESTTASRAGGRP